MTLTGELRDRHSPLARFLRTRFPNARPIAGEVRARLADTTTIQPSLPLGAHYTTIGTAFDWRLRYYVSLTPGRGLQPSPGARPEWIQFLESLDHTTRRAQPVGRRLDRRAEDLLNRHCVVLALQEQHDRAGPEAIQQTLRFDLEPRRTVQDFLAIAEDHWLVDLRSLSWAAYDTLGDLLLRPAVVNPTFAGSADVGGADADLILDNCLVEIKTTRQPRGVGGWLYQLLGYALLDYPDRFQIRTVALYLARQSTFVRWPLDELLYTMAGGTVAPLAELRGELLEVLKREKLGVLDRWPRSVHDRIGTTRPPQPRASSDNGTPGAGAGEIQLELPVVRA